MVLQCFDTSAIAYQITRLVLYSAAKLNAWFGVVIHICTIVTNTFLTTQSPTDFHISSNEKFSICVADSVCAVAVCQIISNDFSVMSSTKGTKLCQKERTQIYDL